MQAHPNLDGSSGPTSIKGEVMRTAMRLIKCRGSGALDFANHKIDVMQDSDDEEDVVFWKRISKQIEILLYSDG